MGSPAYDKQHTKTLMLKLNLKTDKDVLDRLTAVKNKQGYIKELIRADIALRNYLNPEPTKKTPED